MAAPQSTNSMSREDLDAARVAEIRGLTDVRERPTSLNLDQLPRMADFPGVPESAFKSLISWRQGLATAMGNFRSGFLNRRLDAIRERYNPYEILQSPPGTIYNFSTLYSIREGIDAVTKARDEYRAIQQNYFGNSGDRPSILRKIFGDLDPKVDYEKIPSVKKILEFNEGAPERYLNNLRSDLMIRANLTEADISAPELGAASRTLSVLPPAGVSPPPAAIAPVAEPPAPPVEAVVEWPPQIARPRRRGAGIYRAIDNISSSLAALWSRAFSRPAEAVPVAVTQPETVQGVGARAGVDPAYAALFGPTEESRQPAPTAPEAALVAETPAASEPPPSPVSAAPSPEEVQPVLEQETRPVPPAAAVPQIAVGVNLVEALRSSPEMNDLANGIDEMRRLAELRRQGTQQLGTVAREILQSTYALLGSSAAATLEIHVEARFREAAQQTLENEKNRLEEQGKAALAELSAEQQEKFRPQLVAKLNQTMQAVTRIANEGYLQVEPEIKAQALSWQADSAERLKKAIVASARELVSRLDKQVIPQDFMLMARTEIQRVAAAFVEKENPAIVAKAQSLVERYIANMTGAPEPALSDSGPGSPGRDMSSPAP